MELVCVGLNHRTAPVEVRERFAVPAGKLGDSAKQLLEIEGLAESVVISTCNRTEYYLAGEQAEQAAAELRRRLAATHGADSDPHWYEHHRISAAKHLCRVVSGLDSMVLGETEIFGQAKEAYRQALDAGATSGVLNRLFQRAFGVGKKVRTDTRIQEGATSVAGAAVELAEKIFGKLAGCRVIVIGAGEMSRQTAQALVSRQGRAARRRDGRPRGALRRMAGGARRGGRGDFFDLRAASGSAAASHRIGAPGA